MQVLSSIHPRSFTFNLMYTTTPFLQTHVSIYYTYAKPFIHSCMSRQRKAKPSMYIYISLSMSVYVIHRFSSDLLCSPYLSSLCLHIHL